MKEKVITPQESMEIITQMIDASKHRVSMVDLRISVMWAVLSAAVGGLFLILTMCSVDNPWYNLVWLAIPAIGVPMNIAMNRKKEPVHNKTYIDEVGKGLSNIVGLIAILLCVICFGFGLAGYPQAWLALFFYAFIVVGGAALGHGLLIKEKSYVYGGLFAVMVGFILVIMQLCGFPMLAIWCIPLYMVCFLVMWVIPGYIVAKKLKNKEQ